MATTRSFDLATAVSSNGKIQGSSVAGGSAADATANIHADPSALPTSGNQTGDMAFVQSTNNVMIWDGSSWKTIANVTNTTPNIAGGSALTSYILAKDGTPTVVTINATDPEGSPLTYAYSVTQGSLGNTATVSQSNNVFTITPSTNPNDVGSFTLTFTASDGVNTTPAVSRFTLTFVLNVSGSQHTEKLIQAVSTGNNRTLVDSSSSNHTMTRVGNPNPSPVTPYRPSGGYSANFIGDRCLEPVTADTHLSWGTGDFCIEFWICGQEDNKELTYTTSLIFRTGDAVSENNLLSIGLTNEGRIIVYGYDGSGTGADVTSNCDVLDNNWHHVAVTRYAGNLKIYFDGLADKDSTAFANIGIPSSTATKWQIGGAGAGVNVNKWDGWLSNFRVVSGSAVYSNEFLPTINNLTSISGTKLLLFVGNELKDYSSVHGDLQAVSGKTLPEMTSFCFLPTEEYAPSLHNGSVYFHDHTATSNPCHVTVPASNDFHLTGEFTIEAWVYIRSDGQSYIDNKWTALHHAGDSDNKFVFGSDGTRFAFGYHAGNTGGGIAGFWDGTKDANQWVHIAVSRNSSNLIRVFKRGILKGTWTDASAFGSASGTVYLGCKYGAGDADIRGGHISDLRITKTCDRDVSFSPPVVKTSSTGTTFHYRGGVELNIIDKGNKAIKDGCKVLGNVTAATDTTDPWGGNEPMLKFPGAVNDRIETSPIYFKGENTTWSRYDHTVDFWMKDTASGGSPLFSLVSGGQTGSPNLGWKTKVDNGNLYIMFNNTEYQTGYPPNEQWIQIMHPTSAPTVSTLLNDGNWHHVCLHFFGLYRVECFIDGKERGRYQSSANICYPDGGYTISIGGQGFGDYDNTSTYAAGTNGTAYYPLTGYMTDIRVTSGRLRCGESHDIFSELQLVDASTGAVNQSGTTTDPIITQVLTCQRGNLLTSPDNSSTEFSYTDVKGTLGLHVGDPFWLTRSENEHRGNASVNFEGTAPSSNQRDVISVTKLAGSGDYEWTAEMWYRRRHWQEYNNSNQVQHLMSGNGWFLSDWCNFNLRINNQDDGYIEYEQAKWPQAGKTTYYPLKCGTLGNREGTISNDDTSVPYSVAIRTGRWYHIVVQQRGYEGDQVEHPQGYNGHMEIFVNGRFVNGSSGSIGPHYQSPHIRYPSTGGTKGAYNVLGSGSGYYFTIGGTGYSTYYGMDGQISNFRFVLGKAIYSREQTIPSAKLKL